MNTSALLNPLLTYRFGFLKKTRNTLRTLVYSLIALTPAAALASSLNTEITLQDDLHNSVRLHQPAQRIVSLAPSVTELLFSAGAGDKVVAAVDYSDYP
ncbi:MAG: hypothetical protein R3207_03690, partial [Oceanospirillum sp.]|nr:hypothetical protein [Oceanospirillum sp.]